MATNQKGHQQITNVLKKHEAQSIKFKFNRQSYMCKNKGKKHKLLMLYTDVKP